MRSPLISRPPWGHWTIGMAVGQQWRWERGNVGDRVGQWIVARDTGWRWKQKQLQALENIWGDTSLAYGTVCWLSLVVLDWLCTPCPYGWWLLVLVDFEECD